MINEGDTISLHFDRGHGQAWFEINGALVGKVVQNEMFQNGYVYPYLSMSQKGMCFQELKPQVPILKKKESVPGTADNTPEEESKTITGIISPYKSKRLD